MIGKSILHYKILEKLGSPHEIIIFKISQSDNFIISPGKPHEILVFNVSGIKKRFISRGKGGIL